MQTPELPGKIAIVTGGSRGIGRGIALKLAQEGATVVINSTEGSRELVGEVIKTMKGYGVDGLWVPGDISQEETGERLVAETVEHFGRLDILVHNAGITDNDFAIRTTGERWRRVIETNLSSGFYVGKPAYIQMNRQREGVALFVSSVVAHGNAGQASYAASKSGLEGLMRGLAVEYMSLKRPIRANAVAFGGVKTDMVEKLTDEQREALIKATPLGRLITIEEASEVALFLVSPRSAIINGAVIDADGGMLRR